MTAGAAKGSPGFGDLFDREMHNVVLKIVGSVPEVEDKADEPKLDDHAVPATASTGRLQPTVEKLIVLDAVLMQNSTYFKSILTTSAEMGGYPEAPADTEQHSVGTDNEKLRCNPKSLRVERPWLVATLSTWWSKASFQRKLPWVLASPCHTGSVLETLKAVGPALVRYTAGRTSKRRRDDSPPATVTAADNGSDGVDLNCRPAGIDAAVRMETAGSDGFGVVQHGVSTADRAMKRRKHGIESFESAAGKNSDEDMQCVEIHCKSTKVPIMRAVVAFMYTKELPQNASVIMLMKMIQAADYLGCELCSRAAAEAVSNCETSLLTAADISTVVRVLLNDLAAADSTAENIQTQCVRALCNLAKANLLQKHKLHLHDAFKVLFGDARKVLLDEKLKSLFCSLPLPAITIWGSMDDMVVDAEDTVAILLVHWMNTDPKARSTDGVKSELSALIRYPFISQSCLRYLKEQKQFKQKGLESISKPRVLSSQDHLELLWQISVTDIQSCVDSGEDLAGPHGYWAGFNWNVCMTSETDGSHKK